MVISQRTLIISQETGVLLGAAILSTVSCLGLFEVGQPILWDGLESAERSGRNHRFCKNAWPKRKLLYTHSCGFMYYVYKCLSCSLNLSTVFVISFIHASISVEPSFPHLDYQFLLHLWQIDLASNLWEDNLPTYLVQFVKILVLWIWSVLRLDHPKMCTLCQANLTLSRCWWQVLAFTQAKSWSIQSVSCLGWPWRYNLYKMSQHVAFVCSSIAGMKTSYSRNMFQRS